VSEGILAPVNEPQTASITAGEALAGTFSRPSETFERLRKSPTWWLPFLLWMLFGIGASVAMMGKVDWERSARDAMEKRAKAGGPAVPEDALPRIAGMMKTMGTVMAPVGTAVFFFVIALVLWAAAKMFAGEVRFGQMLALWGHANLGNVVGTVLSIPVLLAMAPESLTLDGLPRAVKSNLGAFLPEDSAPAVLSLASAFDIFSLATLALTVLAFRRIPGLSKGAATAIPIVLWLLFVIGRAGFMAMRG